MVGKTVFVTVGTTHFDALIAAVVEEATLKILVERGYTNVVLQIGDGKVIPKEHFEGIELSYFRLKPSIAASFAAADLVISHAGAGSCLEGLEAGKPLVAVVNDTLMANHQTELAEELSNHGFCIFCYPSTLQSTLANLDIKQLKKYVPGNPKLLAQHLDSVIKLMP
ncbi:hypothetical protein SK128_023664 [Halocaridina rubra]|uniref:UDP-N-acetylglucosamine transferase subunit ALG13 n=1 Tax=Halocaridina rubra TaxID=373956 RepID=A0AAN8XL30_HALRR